MNSILDTLKDWRFIIPSIIGLIALLWSICNSIIGKLIAQKIQNNEIKHINIDIENIKKDDKDFKKEIQNDIHKIRLGIGRIEGKQKVRDAICNERHNINNK